MIQTLRRNWLLLAACAVLNAIIAGLYLFMHNSAEPLTFRMWNGAVSLVGQLALIAGACAIAAGIWRSARGKCWLLVLNGLALVALGVIQYGFVRFPISFLSVALLVLLLAASMGLLEFGIARTLRSQKQITAGWSVTLAGVASLGFALAFLALGFGWISIEPGSHADLLWLGSWFAFSALCLLGLSLGLHAGPKAS